MRATVVIEGVRYVSQPWREMELGFYPSGALRCGLLDDRTTIQGLPMCCEVAFYESGRLRCGRLSAQVTIGGVEYREYIYLHEDGSLHSAMLAADARVDGLLFLGDQYVDFDRAGRVVAGCLAEERPGIRNPSFIRVEPGKAPVRVLADAERLSWQSGLEGCAINAFGFEAWTDGPFGGSGAGCTFRDFLQGSLNEVCRGAHPQDYPRIHAMVKERHAVVSDVSVEMRLLL